MAGKRSRGEGTAYQMKNGTWRGLLMDGYKDDGKKNMRSFYADTKAEVFKKIHEYQKQKDEGVKLDPQLAFETWADLWYDDYKTQVAPSTYSGYRYTLNALKKHFGKMALIDIIPIHINQFFTKEQKAGYSFSKISKCRAMLIQILDSAVNNGLLVRNAARNANPIKDNHIFSGEKESKKDAFTLDEQKLMLDNLPDDLAGNSIRFLLGTGLRVQELLALTKEDIAEDGSWVSIKKAVKMVDGKALLGSTKNTVSVRRVPVPEHYRSYAIYLRSHGSRPFIWKSSKVGKPYSIGAFRKKYYKALQCCPTVRKLSPHCCRHTYVTSLQAKGVSMENIAKLTGHSKISTTGMYLHTSLETLDNAVSVLNQ